MKVIRGTCDGTGAAIHVCLGQVPTYVKVRNLEDAGSHLISAEWTPGMAEVSALDEGIKADNGAEAVLAANGISAYAGGDEIVYDKNTSVRWEDSSGNSVEEVYVDGRNKEEDTGLAYRCYGDAERPNPHHGEKVKAAPGFTIGTDADLNANGEKLEWLAFIDGD